MKKEIKSLYRKYFFKFTSYGRNGWKKEEMTDYYWEGN